MDTDKLNCSNSENLNNKLEKQPNYLSGKIIDGLNGKLFKRDKVVYKADADRDNELDYNSKDC
ncbi:hypothetical protein MG290_01405 [Flavobacterium sp. CBA20B-1]|uniref:hypothetical protein n=1 Tax=unclassified Flavobacterium TaxID=196869 RepID=UPI0022253C73|nr:MULTISPECIES: hypothetical protein [unclassified Flavobacterium]WCM42355.1 hypothetical protein MG290_01405 [Flavobacterium sp. CBA20B-1]